MLTSLDRLFWVLCLLVVLPRRVLSIVWRPVELPWALRLVSAAPALFCVREVGVVVLRDVLAVERVEVPDLFSVLDLLLLFPVERDTVEREELLALDPFGLLSGR